MESVHECSCVGFLCVESVCECSCVGFLCVESVCECSCVGVCVWRVYVNVVV